MTHTEDERRKGTQRRYGRGGTHRDDTPGGGVDPQRGDGRGGLGPVSFSSMAIPKTLRYNTGVLL